MGKQSVGRALMSVLRWLSPHQGTVGPVTAQTGERLADINTKFPIGSVIITAQ